MTSSTDLIICTSCVHRNVCKNIRTYKKVIEAIHSVSIVVGENTNVYISNIDWLNDISPKCKYYKYTSTR